MSENVESGTRMLPESSTPSLFKRISIFFEGDAYFESVLRALQSAQEEILCETYIFDLDPVGQAFLEAFRQARERGVQVHLMVDGVGSIRALRALHQWCEKHHIDFRVFHPPLFYSQRERSTSTSSRTISRRLIDFIQNLQNFVRFVNKRNHRKLFLIDRKHCFLGSLNLSKVHSHRWRGNQAWRDTGVELISETPLSMIVRAFERTWMRSRDLETPRFRIRRRRGLLARPPTSPFRLNDSFRERFRRSLELRRRIRRAEKRILITNAYFLPRRSLKRALTAAARRGVYVGLCLPALTDVWMVREAGRTLFRQLIKSGVHVFEYQPSILHAKTMVIDDWGLIGSHNLNHRSFMHDLEIDVELSGAKEVSELIAAWDQDIARSQIVTLTELDGDSWMRRFLGQLCYLVRYWM